MPRPVNVFGFNAACFKRVGHGLGLFIGKPHELFKHSAFGVRALQGNFGCECTKRRAGCGKRLPGFISVGDGPVLGSKNYFAGARGFDGSLNGSNIVILRHRARFAEPDNHKAADAKARGLQQDRCFTGLGADVARLNKRCGIREFCSGVFACGRPGDGLCGFAFVHTHDECGAFNF